MFVAKGGSHTPGYNIVCKNYTFNTLYFIACVAYLSLTLAFSFSIEVDFNNQSSEDETYDFRFVKWLTKEKVKKKKKFCEYFTEGEKKQLSTFSYSFILQGLATIPVSAFYGPKHRKEFDKYIRFCFVKVNRM